MISVTFRDDGDVAVRIEYLGEWAEARAKQDLFYYPDYNPWGTISHMIEGCMKMLGRKSLPILPSQVVKPTKCNCTPATCKCKVDKPKGSGKVKA